MARARIGSRGRCGRVICPGMISDAGPSQASSSGISSPRAIQLLRSSEAARALRRFLAKKGADLRREVQELRGRQIAEESPREKEMGSEPKSGEAAWGCQYRPGGAPALQTAPKRSEERDLGPRYRPIYMWRGLGASGPPDVRLANGGALPGFCFGKPSSRKWPRQPPDCKGPTAQAL